MTAKKKSKPTKPKVKNKGVQPTSQTKWPKDLQFAYDRLTWMQKKFVDLWTGTATETAKLAGYSNPKQAGSRLAKQVDISRLLSHIGDKENNTKIMTRTQRQELWTEIAQDSEEATKDRLKAAELLGKAKGDFVIKVDANINKYEKMDSETLDKKIAELLAETKKGEGK